jgi:hypothetical protein
MWPANELVTDRLEFPLCPALWATDTAPARAHHYSPFTQMINSKPAHFYGTIEAQSNSECMRVTAAEHHMLVGAEMGSCPSLRFCRDLARF